MTTGFMDKAITVLQLTRDGEELSPTHLYLIQLICNANSTGVTEAAEVEFESVYQDVINGRYRKPWFHGIEHLTKDHEGYVYWKGQQVEHYSFSGREAQEERDSALTLGEKCAYLESHGLKVCSRHLQKDYLFEAPADAPWLKDMCRFNTVMFDEASQMSWIIVRADEENGTAVGRKLGLAAPVIRHIKASDEITGWYGAFVILQSEGAKAQNTYGWNYSRMEKFISAAGFLLDDFCHASA